jgi:hypothetical protein
MGNIGEREREREMCVEGERDGMDRYTDRPRERETETERIKVNRDR